jgi:AcrR family transcriptional regulator
MATSAKTISTRAAQAERTRQQILQTAQRLFAEIGYDATSLQMIADEMGLTKAAVYYYFPAKSDMLDAAVRPGIERIESLLDEAAAIRSRRARVAHLVSGIADFLVQHRRFVVTASTEPAVSRHDSDARSSEIRQRALTLIFGDHPTAVERLSFDAVSYLSKSLPDLVDLTDDELREALKSTMLRILRVPAASGSQRCLDHLRLLRLQLLRYIRSGK